MRLKERTYRWMVDVALTAVVWIILLSCYFVAVPPEKGFICSDPHINYPYRPSTVGTAVLVSSTMIISMLLITITEIFLWAPMKRDKKLLGIRLGRNLLTFMWGYAVVFDVVFVAKYSMGALRPNFIDVCQPKYITTSGNCSNIVGQMRYVEPDIDFICTNPDKRAISDARQSFPSGHAAAGAFCAAFLSIYAQFKWRVDWTMILVPFLQMTLACLALYNAVLRVTDNKHYQIDIWAGALIGSLVAILTAYRLFSFKEDVDVPERVYQNGVNHNHINHVSVPQSPTRHNNIPSAPDCQYPQEEHGDNEHLDQDHARTDLVSAETKFNSQAFHNV
ncbi:unnamed protein product [Owenia fusiformis]|uniref:Uncharacterized protein n=1 Tax=Owenia fusiformis TaxID=6347 RepID=A0A8J1UAA9_OWEFU|nr:unnamed protein product [Owenia fusiformis]